MKRILPVLLILAAAALGGAVHAEVGFVRIVAGTFVMGSPPQEPGRDTDEAQQTVTLTRSFLMQAAEVTNGQYVDLLQWAHGRGYITADSAGVKDDLDGSTVELVPLEKSQIEFRDGVFTAANPGRPVAGVNWYGAAAYCDWLSLQEGLPRAYDHGTWTCNQGDAYGARGYRLPTEAEWEYACRAGGTGAFSDGDITDTACGDPVLEQAGWYCGNADGRSHDVATKPANAWGLHDMHGNVVEWCQDRYAGTPGAGTDPQGPEAGDDRILRGGSWYGDAQDCRCAARYGGSPADSWYGQLIGFRPVRTGF